MWREIVVALIGRRHPTGLPNVIKYVLSLLSREPETMDETVTAAEANRSFSRLLRGVREGRRYVVTSHGKPVAQIIPAAPTDREAARRALLDHLARQRPMNVPRWTRDELYEDEP